MKGIFTVEQVKQIEKASQHYVYQIALLTFGSKSPFSILKVSPKGLIFVNGTDDSGFNHIHKRHLNNSKVAFWTQFKDHKGNVIERKDGFGRRKHKLDNPSQFHPYSIPVHDFVIIADTVYNNGNFNLEKNKNPELFDLYDGLASGLEGKEVLYRLLLYKNSRLVHTLFPLSKDFSPRNPIVHFARQSAKSTVSIPSGQVHVEVPYTDEYDVVRFIVIIRNDPENPEVEYWFVQANFPNGMPWATVHYMNKKREIDMDTSEFLERLDTTDLAPLEKLMKNIDSRMIK